MISEKTKQRLEEIRCELSAIYMALDDPKGCSADLQLKKEIEILSRG